MVSRGLNFQKIILTALLIFIVSQTAFGKVLQDILAGPENTCSSLRKFGYNCESHTVTTEDGYILAIFRVLCPNANITETTRPVAFLMHGLLCSSSLWTISKETSLAMTMCDSGYDVWLGNARGNQFSNKHVTLSLLDPSFYKFSWSEIATTDLPNMLNYTLRYTGQNNLCYVGHSQGSTVFFALASENPRLASSLINSAHLLSPVVFTKNWQGIVPTLSKPIFGLPDPLSDVTEVKLLPKVVISELLGRAVCEDTVPSQDLCEDVLEILFGESELTNKTVLPGFLKTFPAGSSLRQYKHYLQEMRNGNFAKYDFGMLLNLQKYGSAEPPQYQLQNVNVPTFLYHADHDYLANLEDIHKLIANLNPDTLKAAHLFPGYNHFDYIYANNVKEDLHRLVLQDMNTV